MDANPQVAVPPEIRHFFSRLVQGMSMPFGPQQYEPVPSGPPKKHATQSALDKLKPVETESLPETDRRCHICMQDYLVKQVGPRSPYVEDVKDEEDQDVTRICSHMSLTDDQEDTPEPKAAQEAPSNTEEGETPVQMPCGHVFGSTCLKEWLYQSPTCPLCRVEVESYTDEPHPSESPFPWFAPPPQQQAPDQSGEPMQVDASNAETGITAPQPQPQFFPHLAFQFIITPVPPPPSSAPNPAPAPNPQVSRSAPAHAARHHPYSRSATPAVPSVVDRPDLFCAQRGPGLCPHDISDENLIRLECGHAYHPDCLETSMISSGYSIDGNEMRCPRCRRWMNVLQ